MKKLVRIITVIFIISTIFTQIALAEETKIIPKFSDLDETYWAYKGIEKLVEAGFIVGYPDGSFQPNGNITRAELIKIVNKVFSYSQKQESTKFTDVKSDDWFFDNILIAQKVGYIKGYPDDTFRPNENITRQEFCTILDSINGFVELPFENSISDEVSPWAVEYVNKIVSNRIMALDENNKFRATEKVTRAEVCDALAKFVILEEPVTGVPSNGGSVGDDSLTDEELNETMDTVTRRLEKGVLPNLTTDAQKEIVEDIISNMNEYKADSNHNYEDAAIEVYKKYNELNTDEKKVLRDQIQLQNSTKDLLELKGFFFPDVDL